MRRKLLWIVVPVLLLAGLVVLLLNMFCSAFWPNELQYSSPTGEYVLEQKFTGFLAVGYRGKTFLIAEGHRYFVDDIGPGLVRWVSDSQFEFEYAGLRKSHSVAEFTG